MIGEPENIVTDDMVRAALDVQPFDDGDEPVQYILMRGLSAMGFNLVTPATWDVMRAALEAALRLTPSSPEPREKL